jgi:hypothetical protein
MLWIIDGEEYVFNSWEELGTSLRDVCKEGRILTITCGAICEDCNGQGEVTGFVGSPSPIAMECFSCNATGIKH